MGLFVVLGIQRQRKIEDCPDNSAFLVFRVGGSLVQELGSSLNPKRSLSSNRQSDQNNGPFDSQMKRSLVGQPLGIQVKSIFDAALKGSKLFPPSNQNHEELLRTPQGTKNQMMPSMEPHSVSFFKAETLSNFEKAEKQNMIETSFDKRRLEISKNEETMRLSQNNEGRMTGDYSEPKKLKNLEFFVPKTHNGMSQTRKEENEPDLLSSIFARATFPKRVGGTSSLLTEENTSHLTGASNHHLNRQSHDGYQKLSGMKEVTHQRIERESGPLLFKQDFFEKNGTPGTVSKSQESERTDKELEEVFKKNEDLKLFYEEEIKKNEEKSLEIDQLKEEIVILKSHLADFEKKLEKENSLRGDLERLKDQSEELRRTEAIITKRLSHSVFLHFHFSQSHLLGE